MIAWSLKNSFVNCEASEEIETVASYINNPTVHDRKYGGIRPSTAILMDLVMAHMTVAQVETATGGILVSGSKSALLSGISIDSRTLRLSDLFFAIRGTRNDGHDHVLTALQKGASGVVVDFRYEIPEGFPANKILLRVENTHEALKDLAACVRRQWRGSLVGITGSMGKTTTKEFMTQVLQTEFSVYRSPGNYNNLFGLPLAIFGLSPEDHIGIFEMGMSAPGEIAEMCRIALPDVGVITNVAPVHLEFFDSVEAIARVKSELAEGLAAGGTLIYNADDPLVSGIAGRFSGDKISFGLSASADIRAEEIEITGLMETRFRLVCEGAGRRAVIHLGGAHYVMNALPAVALARRYTIGIEQITESLRHLRQAHMRGQILNFQEGFTVIDDSYNSSPCALTQMIETLTRIPHHRRRILVAGEMLELGKESESLHRRCGTRAAEGGVDIVVGVQGAAREIVRGAVAAGMPDTQVHFFTEANPASDFICRNVKPGDLVLIKGSRGVHLEKMVQALRAAYTEMVG
jgi:UDP-N-acetylmuramoyl-tripeptide--D-alanyl-D-alanine ligase